MDSAQIPESLSGDVVLCLEQIVRRVERTLAERPIYAAYTPHFAGPYTILDMDSEAKSRLSAPYISVQQSSTYQRT